MLKQDNIKFAILYIISRYKESFNLVDKVIPLSADFDSFSLESSDSDTSPRKINNQAINL